MLELPDLVQCPKVTLSKNLDCVIGRRGALVTARIGNADLKPMDYAEAIRTGQYLINQGGAAMRAGEIVSRLTFSHHHLECHPKVLLKIGQWIMAKGSEAKLMTGDTLKRVYVG